MNRIAMSGNARTNNHRGTVTFSPSLKGMPSDYAVLVTAAAALLAKRGAHVIGYELDAENNLKGFEVFTDEAIGDFSWIVVELAEGDCDIQVRWFGARGDDKTDDTAAIQNAINAASGRAASVVFGAGVFRYSDTILIPPGSTGITLIGCRDAAVQTGSVRPITVLRWTGEDDTIATFKIARTFTTFKDVAVENVGKAAYFAEVTPDGAGRVHFYRVSAQATGAGDAPDSKPFGKAFLKVPASNYDRIERCEFTATAPVIVDVDGTEGGGYTTFFFVDNILDSYFDTDVFRITNCPFEILKIVNNTFNAQPNSDVWTKINPRFRYADAGLTVVNTTAIDDFAKGADLGNLIFRDNEYDDTAYDFSDDPSKFPRLDDKPPTLSPDEINRLRGELQRLAGVRMLKLRRTRNLDLENNNIQGNGQNEAIVELTDSIAHVGKNVAVSVGVLIKTVDDASRVFFKHNNLIWGRVTGLLNSGSRAGIVAMSSYKDGQGNDTREVYIFGQLGNPGGTTTYQFDIPDNQNYTIFVAEWQYTPPRNGYMTRGQKVLVVVRNLGGGTVTFSKDQFKMSGPFTNPGLGKSRAILFEYVGTVDYPKDPQNPNNPYWNGYMVERWCSVTDVDN